MPGLSLGDLAINQSTEQIRFACENCQQTIKAKGSSVGKRARCPSCKTTIVIPRVGDDTSRDEYDLAALSMGDEDLDDDELTVVDLDSGVTESESSPAPDSGYRRHAPAPSPLPSYYTESTGENQPTASVANKFLASLALCFRLLAWATGFIWIVYLYTGTGFGNEPSLASRALVFVLGLTLICIQVAAGQIIGVVLNIEKHVARPRRY